MNSAIRLFPAMFIFIVTGILSIYGAKIEIKPFSLAASLKVPVSCADKDWMEWPGLIDTDSLAQDLFVALDRFSRAPKSYGSSLSRAVCWHLLYRIGVDSGLVVSNRILHSIRQSGKGTPEAVWLDGINCLWSGRMKRGLAILDSIVIPENDAFPKDYLKIYSQCFLPADRDKSPTTLFLSSTAPADNAIYLEKNEVIPTDIRLSLIKSGKRNSLPGFGLSATFELVPVPCLQFPLLNETGESQMMLNLESQLAKTLPAPPAPDPFARTSKMKLKIFAVPGRTDGSVVKFVSSFIGTRFDRVWQTDDLARFGAASVRCRERSAFRDVSGNYCAFVAFDARIFSEHARLRMEPVKRNIGKEEVPVRYLIALWSSEDVENKAERILQNVLAKFDSGG